MFQIRVAETAFSLFFYPGTRSAKSLAAAGSVFWGIVLLPDVKHSQAEDRWYVLGKTDAERLLFIVFKIRKNKIRIISARDMNKKERGIYHEQA